MKLLAHIFCLALALALALSEIATVDDNFDHCHDIEFDAVAVNELGVPYFFKGDHVFKSFNNDAQFTNESFPELDTSHEVDHVDAAFHMHFDNDPSHEHMFFFLDDKAYSYHRYVMEAGYPKKISEAFPGIPDNLDAAVECHHEECDVDSVLFFKDQDIFYYNIETKAVEKKTLINMPRCTAALRFLGHYYCFHGHMFSKFNPKTLEVQANKYPKEARDFFMKCDNYSDTTDNSERERCSRVDLDAITADHEGHMYAFRGKYYLHQKAGSNEYEADSIENDFNQLRQDVDAVMSFKNQLYIIKGNELFLYIVGETNTLVEGYPKPLLQEMGIEGPLKAAFMCENDTVAHVVKGTSMFDIDMEVTPHVASNERPLTHFKKIDGIMCGPNGVVVLDGNFFYKYDSPELMVGSRMLPIKHKVAEELFHCDH